MSQEEAGDPSPDARQMPGGQEPVAGLPSPSTQSTLAPPEALPAPGGAPRVTRDALTGSLYAVLCAWGWFLAALGVLIPLLCREQGTSRAVGGLHSTALAVGTIVAGTFGARLVRRWQRRRTLLGAMCCVVVGTSLLMVGAPLQLTLLAALITSSGGSLMVNVSMTALQDHHDRAAPAVISEGNALASVVSLVSPLAVGACVALGLTWRPAFLGVSVVLGLSLWMLWRTPRNTAALDAPSVAHAERRQPLPSAFWPPAMLIMVCLGVEFSFTTWSADLVRVRTGLDAGAATAIMSVLFGAMAVGRMVAGRLTLWFPIRSVLLYAMCVTGLGWAVLWSATSPTMALVGLGMSGLGIAANYPLGMSLMLTTVPGQRDQATGVSSIASSLAVGSAPFALGALADRWGIHTAFVTIPVMVTVCLLILLLSCHTAAPGDEGRREEPGVGTP